MDVLWNWLAIFKQATHAFKVRVLHHFATKYFSDIGVETMGDTYFQQTNKSYYIYSKANDH